MDGQSGPRGGRGEGAGEHHVLPCNALVSEHRLSEHESGRERGIVESLVDKRPHGEAGRGEFA